MDNTKFQIAALMFERRGIIYILIVASLESVRWQLQQERRSNEVTGVRQCLTELEWNLQQVRAMWQGVWANDTQHRSMNTSEQCRCHNEFSQRWKEKKNWFIEREMQNSSNWHSEPRNYFRNKWADECHHMNNIFCRSQLEFNV